MYFLFGKLFAIVFIILGIGLMFFKGGRSFIADLTKGTLLSDILTEGDWSGIIGLSSKDLILLSLIFVIISLFYLFCIIIGALMIWILYPLVIVMLFIMIRFHFLKRKK